VKDYYAIDARLVEPAVPPLDQLRAMLREANRLGLEVMMDLVVNHTAFDSPLVEAHPEWFRRDADGRIAHPGAMDGQRVVVWRDLAEVDNAGSPDREALWAFWRKLALQYAGMGFRGFRCDAAYQVPDALWRELIGAVKREHPGMLFFGETLGCSPEQLLVTAAAGFDFIFNSSKWWNFRDAWCLEQYAATAPLVPSISFPESHDTPRLAEELNGDRMAVLQRYAFAAMFSTGVMMPMGFEYGFRRRLHVVETTPGDWEAPQWDLTAPIAAINRTKAAFRPFNEEGPIQPVELGSPRLFGFRKQTRDGQEEVLVILNLDREAPVGFRLPPGALRGTRLVTTDPCEAACCPLPGSGQMELPPSGSRIVSCVEAAARLALPDGRKPDQPVAPADREIRPAGARTDVQEEGRRR
jgi:starch synthase (maltosyl-transferring)